MPAMWLEQSGPGGMRWRLPVTTDDEPRWLEQLGLRSNPHHFEALSWLLTWRCWRKCSLADSELLVWLAGALQLLNPKRSSNL